MENIDMRRGEKIEVRSRFTTREIKRNFQFQIVFLIGIFGVVLCTIGIIMILVRPDGTPWPLVFILAVGAIDVWTMCGSYYSATGASLKFWFESRKLKMMFGVEVVANQEEFTKRGRQHVLPGLIDQALKAKRANRGKEADWCFVELGEMYDTARYFFVLPSYTEILALADFGIGN